MAEQENNTLIGMISDEMLKLGKQIAEENNAKVDHIYVMLVVYGPDDEPNAAVAASPITGVNEDDVPEIIENTLKHLQQIGKDVGILIVPQEPKLAQLRDGKILPLDDDTPRERMN